VWQLWRQAAKLWLSHTKYCICNWAHSSGCEHKGTMSRKPVFEKITKIQRYYVSFRRDTTFVLSTLALWLLLTKSPWFQWCKQIRPSMKLLTINILRYFVIKDVNDGLEIKSMASLKTFVQQVDGHSTFVHPLRTNELPIKVIFCFYNELKFHILSRECKMLGLTPSIKISISSKSGHSTFVLWTIHRQYFSQITEFR